jgi:hypothetical protein
MTIQGSDLLKMEKERGLLGNWFSFTILFLLLITRLYSYNIFKIPGILRILPTYKLEGSI